MKRGSQKEISSFFSKKVSRERVEVVEPSTFNPPLIVASPQGSPFNQEEEVHVNDGRLSVQDIANLPSDPGKRRKMIDFHQADREIVRREYLRKKPCQPRNYKFPQTLFSGHNRRFKPEWFDSHRSWLEYSVEKDAAFCFACYLFKSNFVAGGGAFVGDGFKAWNRTDQFLDHVGGPLSAHNHAVEKMLNFDKQETSIVCGLSRQTEESRTAYRARLEASIECLKWLLLQGLPFRGHDEREDSQNSGNFLQLLKLLSKHNPEYAKVVLKNAPGNSQLTSSTIQREIINACAQETLQAILVDLNGDLFSILVDESADISDKEQMALCLRYVNKKGEVQERFVGIVHVGDTTSLTLKAAIEKVLGDLRLLISRVRGQGYDGANNMRGSIKGLQALILKESPSAYYVHCFAHQLQLVLVAVSHKNCNCAWFFVDVLMPLLSFVGGSPKRRGFLRERQAERVVEELSTGDLISGTGLNQELGLSKPGDTRWGSHFKTIVNIIKLYPSLLDSLDAIGDVSDSIDLNKCESLLRMLRSFDFIFLAHLMMVIFGITNDLNMALQKRDQDIVNAMSLVSVTRNNLQAFRDDGWHSHMEKVTSFMSKNDIEIPNLDGTYVGPGKRSSRVKGPQATIIHHFRVDVFMSVLDLLLAELDSRFSEVTKRLLVCMSCFCPANRFSSFDKSLLLELAQFYPSDFSCTDLVQLEYLLDNFIMNIRDDERFWDVKNINEFSIKLVETNKHETFPKVYLLLKLVLLLPVATATVERAFSAMTIVKDRLRNSMGDQLLNDCLVTYLGKDVFYDISMDNIVANFRSMRTRRDQA